MTCRAARSRMALAAGGDLGERSRLRWERHLAGCPACREELARYRKALETARSLAREDKPIQWSEPEWRRVLDRVLNQDIHPERPSGLRRPGWAWASAAGALVLLIAGGIIFMKRDPGKPVIAELVRGADVVLPAPPLRSGAVPGPRPVPASAARAKPA